MWNIKGLKPKLRTDLDYVRNFCQRYDIIGICETWGEKKSDFDEILPGYQVYSKVWTRRSSRGRIPGGVSLIVKNILLPYITLLVLDCKYLVGLWISRHYTGLEVDLVLLCVYLPPQGSTSYDGDSEGICNLESIMLDLEVKYDNCAFCIMGDFNARVGSEEDFIKYDSLKYICDTNGTYERQYFDKVRMSEDEKVNAFGIDLINLCKTHDVHMLNGRSSKDVLGEFTCVTANGKSLVDYVLCSSLVLDKMA